MKADSKTTHLNLCNGRTGQATSAPNVVRRLSVNKGQVLRSGILGTSFSLCVLPLRNGLKQELMNQKRCVHSIRRNLVRL